MYLLDRLHIDYAGLVVTSTKFNDTHAQRFYHSSNRVRVRITLVTTGLHRWEYFTYSITNYTTKGFRLLAYVYNFQRTFIVLRSKHSQANCFNACYLRLFNWYGSSIQDIKKYVNI